MAHNYRQLYHEVYAVIVRELGDLNNTVIRSGGGLTKLKK